MERKDILLLFTLLLATTCLSLVSTEISSSAVTLQEIGEEIHHQFTVNNADVILAKVESSSSNNVYYGGYTVNNIVMESGKLSVDLGNSTDELPYSAVISIEVTKNRYLYPPMLFQTVFKVCVEPETKEQPTEATPTPSTEENETEEKEKLWKALTQGKRRPLSYLPPCETPTVAPQGMKKFYGLVSVYVSTGVEGDDGQLVCKEFHNFQQNCCYQCTPAGSFNLTDFVNADSNSFYFQTDVVFYEFGKN